MSVCNRSNSGGATGIVSMKQLLDVFRICDPQDTGRVRIEYLLDLANVYAQDGAQVR